MKKYEVDACMFSNWYHLFESHTIKSVAVAIKDEKFVRYLTREEGHLILPEGFDLPAFSKCESSDDEAWSDDEEVQAKESFPEILNEMKSAINELGGKVFPKCGWSSPKDAEWVFQDSTLKCTTPGEVLLLIKSSTFTTYDLTNRFSCCEDVQPENHQPENHQIVLRKWVDIHPGSEFRCFVINSELMLVCQRNTTTHYDHIEKEHAKLVKDLRRFVEDVVVKKFPLQSFVLDVSKNNLMKRGFLIVDFNPYCDETDGLLYGWDEIKENKFDQRPDHITQVEINTDASSIVKLRYVNKQVNIQPSEYMKYGIPQDFYDLSVGNDPKKLIDFMRMKTQNANSDSESSDEEWKLPDKK